MLLLMICLFFVAPSECAMPHQADKEGERVESVNREASLEEELSEIYRLLKEINRQIEPHELHSDGSLYFFEYEYTRDPLPAVIYQRTWVKKLTLSEMAKLYQSVYDAAHDNAVKKAFQTILTPPAPASKTPAPKVPEAKPEFHQEKVIREDEDNKCELSRHHKRRMLALNRDGKYMVVGCVSGIARIVNSCTLASRQELIDHTAEITSAAWSPDNSLVATGSADNTVRIWDVDTGACKNIFAGHDESIHTLSWDPDGNRIATGSLLEETARVWDRVSATCTALLPDHPAGVGAITWRDSNSVVIGSRVGKVSMWDMAKKAYAHTVRCGTGYVHKMALSCPGHLLATDADDGVVCVWNTTTGHRVNELRGYAGAVRSLGWSPESDCLAIGSDDKKVHIMQLATNTCVQVLRDYTKPVKLISWSAQGKRLATLSGNGTTHIWQRTLPEGTKAQASELIPMVLRRKKIPHASVSEGVPNSPVKLLRDQ